MFRYSLLSQVNVSMFADYVPQVYQNYQSVSLSQRLYRPWHNLNTY